MVTTELAQASASYLEKVLGTFFSSGTLASSSIKSLREWHMWELQELCPMLSG